MCEVALGNTMNSLDQYSENSAGYFCDGNDYKTGYHSVRVMGSSGPDFNQSWIQKETDAIWPIGDVIQYAEPFYSYSNKHYEKLSEIIKSPVKNVKKIKAQRKKKMDSDEDESMEESLSSDEDYEGKESDLWEKVRIKSTNKKISNIVPN